MDYQKETSTNETDHEPDNFEKKYHRVALYFNDNEHKLMEHYFKKYRTKNKTKTMKSAIMRAFLKQLEQDCPTLFDQVD